MKAKKPDYRIIYAISIIEMAIFLLLSPVLSDGASDTITYFEAWDTLLTGHLHDLRTPLYPLFIGSLRAISGSTVCYYAACIIQCAVFVLSIGWFRRLASETIGNSTIVFWATAIYAIYPGPLTLNCTLITESFALSGITGMLWLICKAYKNNSTKAAIGAGAVMLCLVLLRPAFIYLPCVLGVFWLIAAFNKTRRRAGMVSIACCAATIACLGIYCAAMNKEHGISTPSSVSATNNYFTARNAGLISSEYAHGRLAEVIDSIISERPVPSDNSDIWQENRSIVDNSTPAEFSAYVSATIKAHPKEAIKYIVTKRIPEAVSDDAVYGGSILPPVRAITKLIGVNIGGAFALMLLFMVIYLRKDVRARRLSYMPWLMAAIFGASLFTAVVGAQGEWQRLMLPAYPTLLIMASLTLRHAIDVAGRR